jgi:hypothetical protein
MLLKCTCTCALHFYLCTCTCSCTCLCLWVYSLAYLDSLRPQLSRQLQTVIQCTAREGTHEHFECPRLDVQLLPRLLLFLVRAQFNCLWCLNLQLLEGIGGVRSRNQLRKQRSSPLRCSLRRRRLASWRMSGTRTPAGRTARRPPRCQENSPTLGER